MSQFVIMSYKTDGYFIIMILTDFIDMNNIDEVWNEVIHNVKLIKPDSNISLLDKVFHDVNSIFAGNYSGYKKCDIVYHDLSHTLDVTLAMSRLLHGAFEDGEQFSEKGLISGIIASLFHDVGYIQKECENEDNGAVFTLQHVERSTTFSKDYLTKNKINIDSESINNMILFTDMQIKMDKVEFDNNEYKLIAQILGTADLLGQMSARTYLEKLLYLHVEFLSGKIPGFENEYDLLKKTVDFKKMVDRRFQDDLGRVNKHMQSHFNTRWNSNFDFYQQAIENNMSFLSNLVQNHKNDYRNFLKRGHLVDKLIHLEEKG